MKKIITIILAVCLLFALTACGKTSGGTIAVSGDKVDVGDIALRPEGEADRVYENGGLKLLIPLEYDEFLLTETPADDERGMLFSVSEKASIEAAKASGYGEDGAGWLFGIRRVDEAAMHELICYDMSGEELFAKDGKDNYYLLCHPTDVRYFREDNEAMARDQELWTKYNEWARRDVPGSFIAENSGLSAVTYGNSALEMDLARIAYQPGVNYSIATLEYGPLTPDESFDAAPYLERLMTGMTLETIEGEAPAGEYVVLAFPDEDIRFDFFRGDLNVIRQVWSDGYERLFRASFADESVTATDIMQEWYDALAESAGPIAPGGFLGGWTITEDPAVTEDAKAAFEKAAEGLLGVDYAPVALLGTQIVSGTNYCLLCSAKAVAPDAASYWAAVIVNADLQGGAELRDIIALDLGDIAESGEIKNAEKTGEQLAGGWTATEDGTLTDNAGAAFEKAAERLLGVSYRPVALLGTQVVSGTNYSILASAQTVAPGAAQRYVVMTIYENLQGEVEVLGIADLDPGLLA